MAIEKWVIALSVLIFSTIQSNNSAMEMDLSSYSTTSSSSSSVTAMYVLGDSSVDCGDNTPFYTILHRNLSLFPCNGSDITLLPQLLAKQMGLPYTIPFYSQNSSIHGILGGVNFGSAEATILYPESQGYQSLNQQLRQVFETIQLLQLQLGEKTANDFISSSLFYISFGKDDFIDYFLYNSSKISSLNYSGQNFSHILVHQMTNAIRNLYATNVRKIIVSGVLPLGCAPRLLLKWDNSSESEKKGCFDEVNLMVLEYNTRLEDSVVSINAELPDAHIVFCDVYRAMMEFINNPGDYGIEDVKSACCGLGRYGGVSGCISTDMACSRASTRVWWDFYNPTPAVNSLLADSAWSGRRLPSICRPITVQELLSSS
ncbi:hypothetical protein ACJIZ3_017456 [Penstemon smallii]|uniref:Uncharacterized protein n=1 Tax=Penstemon smallii TaxID=265156 RepID=A0ABD3SVL5_9LAMI